MSVEHELIELYQRMAALTFPLCGNCEPDPCATAEYRCCDPLACENARKAALTWGVVLKETGHATLPFMGDKGGGPSGCTVPPHLRPACTMHLCQTNPKVGDSEYLALRTRIRELEAQRGR